jgi:hypothetical protein
LKLHVYDKAKYHDESIQQAGLPEEHATHHTIYFLRWLIENDLMDTSEEQDYGDVLQKFKSGEKSLYDVYNWWDCCLISDMLTDEGNAFAMHYFDFERGKYLKDYTGTLQGDLPSEFHIPYTEENYQKLKPLIDRRYQEWKSSPKKKKWWPI